MLVQACRVVYRARWDCGLTSATFDPGVARPATMPVMERARMAMNLAETMITMFERDEREMKSELFECKTKESCLWFWVQLILLLYQADT